MKLIHSPIDRLAAHLLNLYWTGSGDAGTESAILDFGDVIGNESDIADALENGHGTTLGRRNGHSFTLTDHFLMLAEKMLKDILDLK